MGLYIIDMIEPTNFRCRDCIWFIHGCKRIDPPRLTAYVPWFSCDKDRNPNHIICCDFQPNPNYPEMYIDFHRYRDFEELFNSWRTFWMKPCERKLTWWVLNKNRKVSYAVRLEDFLYNTMYDEEGKLKTVYKRYMKQTRKSPYGWRLKVEKCDSILIEDEES